MHEDQPEQPHEPMTPADMLYGVRLDPYTRSLINTLWMTIADVPEVEHALLYELNGTPVNMHQRFCDGAGLPTEDLWERRAALIEGVDSVVMLPAARTGLSDAFYDIIAVQPYL